MPRYAKRALSLDLAFLHFFSEGVSAVLIIVVFFSDSRFAILRLSIRLLSSSTRGLFYWTWLFVKSDFWTSGDEGICFATGWCAIGILGKSFATAGLCYYFLFSSPSSFQLFFFLPAVGLANLVALSALNLLSPLIDLCILIYSPTSTFLLFKN